MNTFDARPSAPCIQRRTGKPSLASPIGGEALGQILRDRGKEWERAKMPDLETAFETHARGDKQNSKFVKTALEPILTQTLASPTIIVQGRFSHPQLRETSCRTSASRLLKSPSSLLSERLSRTLCWSKRRTGMK
jgi:hypothetical protein